MLPTKDQMITWIEEESKKEHIGPSAWKMTSIFVFPLVSLALQAHAVHKDSLRAHQVSNLMHTRVFYSLKSFGSIFTTLLLV